MIQRDALLHYAHFLCIFLLVSLLTSELVLFRKRLPGAMLQQLQALDRFYGIAAGLVIVTGVLLVFFGLKGSAYYAHNPVFWTKMVLFVIVALISIAPTLAFLRLNSRRGADGSVALDDAEFGRIRSLLWAQVAVLVLIPLCAALMANGL
jgi:putative membrane protein